MPDLTYNPNEREHVNFADTLGTLQGRVAKGTVNKSTANAYYIGVELLAKYPGSKSGGEYFLKMDATGHGSGSSERSKNRLIVKVTSAGGLIEGDESIDTARTAAFTVLVLAQLFNALNARSESVSAFRHRTRWLCPAPHAESRPSGFDS